MANNKGNGCHPSQEIKVENLIEGEIILAQCPIGLTPGKLASIEYILVEIQKHQEQASEKLDKLFSVEDDGIFSRVKEVEKWKRLMSKLIWVVIGGGGSLLIAYLTKLIV